LRFPGFRDQRFGDTGLVFFGMGHFNLLNLIDALFVKPPLYEEGGKNDPFRVDSWDMSILEIVCSS